MAHDMIPEDVLIEQWYAFRLKVWRNLQRAVRDAKASGLDQKTIAERIGMDEAQFSRVLSGRTNVTLRTMHNIARAIGYRPEIEFVELAALKPSNLPPRFSGWSDGSVSPTTRSNSITKLGVSTDKFVVAA